MSFLKSIASTFSNSVPVAPERSEDFALVERVKAGDITAFDQLTLKYRERLFSVVYNITSNKEDASDITQDAFIRAFRSIHRFKGNSAFYTWIYRIAVNTAINFLRKNRLRRFFSLETISEEVGHNELGNILASKMVSDKPTFLKELQEKLNEALQSLSLKHRTAVVLFEVEGLSHQEIAAIMKCSEGTVRSRLHYAKNELQNKLRDYIK